MISVRLHLDRCSYTEVFVDTRWQATSQANLGRRSRSLQSLINYCFSQNRFFPENPSSIPRMTTRVGYGETRGQRQKPKEKVVKVYLFMYLTVCKQSKLKIFIVFRRTLRSAVLTLGGGQSLVI